jgi:hypothetical protein
VRQAIHTDRSWREPYRETILRPFHRRFTTLPVRGVCVCVCVSAVCPSALCWIGDPSFLFTSMAYGCHGIDVQDRFDRHEGRVQFKFKIVGPVNLNRFLNNLLVDNGYLFITYI